MTSRKTSAVSRMAPAERREQILACASTLFEERPVDQVSMDEIAELAGVARTLVHHYFGTKRALYLEVVRRLYHIPPLAAVRLTAGTLEDTVEAIVERWLDGVWQHRNMWVATVSVAGPAADPDVQEIMRGVDNTVAQRLAEALGLTDHPDPERLRAVLLSFGAMAKTASREWLVAGTLDRADVKQLLEASLRTIVLEVAGAVRPG